MEPTPSSPTLSRARARTTSFSATAAVVHSPDSNSTQHQPSALEHHQMHPWPSERAKVAAESSLSPPVSPKQNAMAAGQVEFVEPLQQSNNVHPHRHEPWVGASTDNSDSSSNTSSDNDSSNDDNNHHQSSYTHRLRSRSISNIESRPTSFASSSSYTSAVSLSIASSASSSSTSLSSTLASDAVCSSSSPSSSAVVTKPSSDHYHSPTTTSRLQIDLEKTEMFLIDTPPSSHATSPSSPSSSSKSFPLPPSTASQPCIQPSKVTAHKDIQRQQQKKKTAKSTTQIIREISDLVDGRDKTIKIIQYFAKVVLWLFLSNPTQYKVLADRIKALAKQFSTTRKVLRLGHFVDPMATVLHLCATLSMNCKRYGSLAAAIRKPQNQTWRTTVRDRLGMLNSVLGFCQDISDDIYCLGVIGVLDRSFSDKAEPWSNRLWMIGVSIDLHENLQSIMDVRRQIKALENSCNIGKEGTVEGEESRRVKLAQLGNKLHWLQVTTVKLGGDFLFCGYDNLHCSFSDGFQAVSGLTSGIAGAYKFVGKLMES
ncbi:hypothetical protein BGZ83_001459 [Gryganskiella cystojenkinii]|nr:hypothetical protein BGZ83_001459 [Gryganskiella cystojenkinii]